MAIFASSSGFWDEPLVVWFSPHREDWVAWRTWRNETWYFNKNGEWSHEAGNESGFSTRASLITAINRDEREKRN